MERRKICIITGSRAEYGLLYWLMKEINMDEELELILIATGSHLSPEFGLTYKEIERDGFIINSKIEMIVSSDTPIGIAKSIGLGVISFAEAFDRLTPDIIVLLGDRYEMLAAAQAALVLKVPVAHIHGGEKTEGAIDESIRHAVTKMSQLHFVAADDYRRRVIQLGEPPQRVFQVGAMGIDQLMQTSRLSRDEFEKSVGFRLGKLNFLVTYHPVTLHRDGNEKVMSELLSALNEFPEVKIIFTKPNADAEGRILSQMIDQYVEENTLRAISVTNMGQLRYMSALSHVDVVIGNSSSGIYEAPFFYKPTVNIGDRQKGRLKGATIIDCSETANDISKSIHLALSKSFQDEIANAVYLFGEGNSSKKIKEVLKNTDLIGIVQKDFYDLQKEEYV
ncbi:GDP/UDP-N,N'-diacetylbacillosamine 2-epimerase (hydrolyzing) [Paenibacillus plantiphilus]|uniref:GDP/UDP-N,N'-diacetylbacillosamine 2-epimerase (Hydrolyzing) n=1 Tax=Paenibacillus plantiphilus TaxID=2905650 RepID=A0ABN8FYY0_9BACL|nr:UDP-N-acetylglucosamine 2-epimerase [Paenibacillus plantiphilus]CAH1192914.1 GDP/UDP-N,N'-diacetylbacillosamine 2-epimerase (hydrolyzing) [Paenibacillus plantiphilus]